jgi:hypothetical protein
MFSEGKGTISDIDDPPNWALTTCAGRMIAIEDYAGVVDLASRRRRVVLFQAVCRWNLIFWMPARASIIRQTVTNSLEMLGRGPFGLPPSDEDALWA